MKRLRPIVEQDPSRFEYCRALTIQVFNFHISTQKIKAENYALANDLLSRLKHVRCVKVEGYRALEVTGVYQWPMVSILRQNMPEVEHVIIEEPRTDLQDIIDCLDFPFLKTLSLGDIEKSPVSMGGGIVLDQEQARAGSFTSLTLGKYSASASTLRQLLEWPKVLSHFSMPLIYSKDYIGPFAIRSMLLIHKHTLGSLTIGVGKTTIADRYINVSDFSKLEVLGFPRNRHHPDLEFMSDIADRILAPNIKVLRWDFKGWNGRIERWRDFRRREVKWLMMLAREAHARKSTLRRIEIIFDPEPAESQLTDGYPWDLMDAVGEKIRKYGIELGYKTPPITKDRWVSLVVSKYRETTPYGLTLDREGKIVLRGKGTKGSGPLNQYWPKIGEKL
ncbi:hypothetical protein FQN54_009541 [Arachnomyces sp. PD_36]|nr:hypothetical protein FQN54_009541 [Arachnomyces sp. PD_36]